MENEYRRGYELPLTIRKERFWAVLAASPLFLVWAEGKIRNTGIDEPYAWLMRSLYLLLFLIVALTFVRHFGKLHLVPEGIATTLFGRTLRQFPRENIRFLGGIVYMKKGIAYKWICVCAQSMEELAEEQERKTPKMLRNGRSRPGWAEDMAGKLLMGYADSLRFQLGFPRKDIHMIEWSPERLEMLLSMYPGVPWVDLMEKKIRDGEKKEPMPKRRWTIRF